MFERARVGVGEEEAVALKFMLLKYRGTFAEHDMDLGDFSAVKHVIDTKDVRPVKERPRRTPLAFEYYFQGCFRVLVPYSVGSEAGWHCQILY